MVKKIYFIFVSFFLITILSQMASTEINNAQIKANFNIDNNTEINSIILNRDFVLEINTNEAAICKYSENIELNYSSMLNFDEALGTIHRVYFSSLNRGIYSYYIKCKRINETLGSGVLKVNINIDPLITAEIILPNSVLKAGQHEIILKTSNIPINTPTLSYSIDGITYSPIPLSGEGLLWKGYLVIPNTVGEKSGSFKFSAKDLLGRTGDKITKNSIFLIDTKKPAPVESISYKSNEGQIRLNWYYEEDFEEFNIYRSEEPFVGYTNYYKKTSEKYFIDNNLEKGKIYYYRIAAVDKAGNIGDLSKEISAFVLSSNYSSENKGLNKNLVGIVENFIIRINLLNDNIEEIKNSLKDLGDGEKEVLEKINLNNEIENSKKELTNLKKEVESYKMQDLSRDELERKINSAEIKLESIKKKTPESLLIVDKKQSVKENNKEKITEGIIEYFSGYTEEEIKNFVKNSLTIIEKEKFSFETKIYSFEITYLDGTKKEMTLVNQKINSELERNPNISIILKIPEEIENEKLNFKDNKNKFIRSNLIEFESDIKEIVYTIDKKINVEKLAESIVFPVKKTKEEKTLITGKIIREFNEVGSNSLLPLLILFIIAASILLVPRIIFSTKMKAIFKKIKEDIEKNKKEEALETYMKIKNKYKNLNDYQKKVVYKEFKKIENKFKNE